MSIDDGALLPDSDMVVDFDLDEIENFEYEPITFSAGGKKVRLDLDESGDWVLDELTEQADSGRSLNGLLEMLLAAAKVTVTPAPEGVEARQWLCDRLLGPAGSDGRRDVAQGARRKAKWELVRTMGERWGRAGTDEQAPNRASRRAAARRG